MLKMKHKLKGKVVLPRPKLSQNKKSKHSQDILNRSKSYKNLTSKSETSIKVKESKCNKE